MATMSPTEIRQYVYDHLDVESSEVPTSVLDVFMQDGYNRIVGYFDDSPTWLHVEYTFTTIAGQQAYDLDSTGGLTSPTPLQTIADVRGPTWSLKPKPHRQMREQWQQATAMTATPQMWSQWGRSLYLWPAPSGAQVMTIDGTRQPMDWLATNAAPDCPAEFHRVIADYTMGRTYAQQDDPETATIFLDAFLPAVKQLATRYYDGTKAQPVVVNGGKRMEPFRTQKALGPLVYPWE